MIYLTGSTGYIGEKFSSYLCKMKIKHICILKYSKNTSPNKYRTYLYFDLKKKFKLKLKFNSNDILVHLAWPSLDNYFHKDHSKEYPKSHFEFIKKLKKNNLKNIIITGTCLEYGIKNGSIKENEICNPNTEYGKGKLKLLLKLKTLKKKENFKLNWLRLFYIYSEYPKKNTLLNELLTKTKKNKFFVVNKPNEIRDFIDIKKIVKIIFRLTKNFKDYGVINVGSGKPKKIKIIVKKFIEQKKIDNKKIIMNKNNNKDELKFENKAFWADTTKLKRILNV